MSTPDPKLCPVLQETHGLSRSARVTIRRLREHARACTGCPQTGQCRVLDRLRGSLEEALLEVWVELESQEAGDG